MKVVPDIRRGSKAKYGTGLVQKLNCWGLRVLLVHAVCRRDGNGGTFYAGVMRYPDSGGLFADARVRRNALAFQVQASSHPSPWNGR